MQAQKRNQSSNYYRRRNCRSGGDNRGKRGSTDPWKDYTEDDQILIMENYQNNQKKDMENMRNNFLFSWLFASEDNGETEENMKLRGQLLGIDTNLDRVAVVLGVVHNGEK